MWIDRRMVLSFGAAAIMSIAAIASYADETCNSPYMSGLIKGQEDFVHVWTLGVPGMGDESDKLVKEQLGRPHHMKFTANPQRVASLAGVSVH